MKILQKSAVASRTENKSGNLGFSLIEVIIVFLIIAILSVISVPYIFSYKKLYKTDGQAQIIMDLMAETGQFALTRRRTFRFEVDLTDNTAKVIDENDIGAGDDREVKSIALESPGEIRVDIMPTGVTKPDPPGYNDAVYSPDSIGHTSSGNKKIIGHNVWAVRFQRDGTVVNAAGSLINANLYVWIPRAPNSNQPWNKKLVRCLTLAGTSGAVRYWKHDGTKFLPY